MIIVSYTWETLAGCQRLEPPLILNSFLQHVMFRLKMYGTHAKFMKWFIKYVNKLLSVIFWLDLVDVPPVGIVIAAYLSAFVNFEPYCLEYETQAYFVGHCFPNRTYSDFSTIFGQMQVRCVRRGLHLNSLSAFWLYLNSLGHCTVRERKFAYERMKHLQNSPSAAAL